MLSKKENKILEELKYGYNKIADKFAGTRNYWWQDLDFIKDFVKKDSKVLDFGCGNGRLAGHLDNNYKIYIGIDPSRELIRIAKEKYENEKTKFHVIDPIIIQNTSNKILYDTDTIFSIAVFHHFPTQNYSKKIAKELFDYLKPNGKIIITVWNLWNKKYSEALNKSEKKDIYIPFKDNKGNVFNRFHHAFTSNELSALFESVGFKTEKVFENERNIVYIGKKLKP